MDWDDEYDLGPARGTAGPSSIAPARNALPRDLDIDQPMPGVAPFAERTEDGTPLEQLIRHWTNERHAPDILPAQEDLLVSVLDHMRRQVGILNGNGSCFS